jgi:hypothetical protein
MRMSQRISIERKLSTAEEVVARRAMARVGDLLFAEVDGMSVERSYPVMVAVKRVAATGALPRDAVRVLLTEIALVEPGIAARIAAAVGVTITEPSTSPKQ